MKWFEEVQKSLGLVTAIILYGNVNDKYLFDKSKGADYRGLNNFLQSYLMSEDYGIVACYDMVDGLSFAGVPMRKLYEEIMNDQPEAKPSSYKGGFGNNRPKEEQPPGGAANISYPSPSEALTAVRKLLKNGKYPCAVIINYSERLIAVSGQENEEEKRIHILLQKMFQEAKMHGSPDQKRLNNTVFLVTDALGGIPANLYLNNPYAKQVLVDKPAKTDREDFINFFMPYFYSKDGKISRDDLHKFIELTEGMTNIELVNLAMLSKRESIPLEKTKELIDSYKFGKKVDYWSQLDIDKVKQAENMIKRRVIGQDEAVQKVVDMIIRAKMGMSGLQHSSSSSKPKGTLLFVGPTGVGKTELAKATAEFLFGDENACIRFDMSEYNHEHADQRLIGAPPGYVGFEEGGQLTNKVKEKPFSVLLFDEIEKAHPRIFDKFLQILEDGRLTDGKGETIYFSETVIIFTSNLGSDQSFSEEAAGAEVQEHYLEAVNHCFRVEWGRPELLNRIGENIVVFQPVLASGFQREIVRKMLNQVIGRTRELYGLNIVWEESLFDAVINHPDGFRKNGARGAGNIIEKYVLNNLARFLFFNKAPAGQTLRISWRDESGVRVTVNGGEECR